MATPDKVKLDINIAGERIQLTVPVQDQDRVRIIEKDINRLYSDWRVKFNRKTPSELMAMLLFQYASYFFGVNARIESITEELTDISALLDNILGETESDSDSPGINDDNLF